MAGWRHKFSHSVVGFLLASGFAIFLHGMVNNGIVNVNVSTIERRYKLTSTQSGIIASSYDITSCLLCPVLTYFGRNKHKPRIMVLGVTLFALGCILNAVPHFISNPYKPSKTIGPGLCSENTSVNASFDIDDSSLPFTLFILGFMLLGMGSLPLITLGTAYIDDNTTTEKSASYLGILGGVASIGTACGFLVGGYSLSFFVNFGNTKHGLSQDDPAWIGNWWAPFLLCAALSVCSILMLMQFPKDMQRYRVTNEGSGEQAEHKLPDRIRISEPLNAGMLSALKLFLKNPVFMFTIIGTGLECFLLNGFTVFLPKILQNQVLVSPATASLLAGAITVPGAVIGHVSSGFIIRRFEVQLPSILKALCILTLLSGILSLFLLFHCPSPVQGGNSGNCQSREDCRCDPNVFRPVCGSDGNVYFSACHAGCRQRSLDSVHFHSCSCISGNFTSIGSARKGNCGKRCDIIIPFLILLFLTTFLSFSILTPSAMVVMRCTPPAGKSFAVGMQWFAVRVLGSIPSPLIIGQVFDKSCKVWMNGNENGRFCWIYDSTKLAHSATTLAIAVKILSLSCFSLAFRKSKTDSLQVFNRKVQEEMKLDPHNDVYQV